MMVELIRAEEVEVKIHGENWNEANAEAEKFLATHSDAYFVHPYDQETTWIGHSSIVHEIKDQMKECFEVDEAPESIVTCVGGGGLAIGKFSQILENYVIEELSIVEATDDKD